MTALPHMPMYWERFFADTLLLPAEARGVYALLLGRMWLNGGWLPADDAALARMLGLHTNAWVARYKTLLTPFLSHQIPPMIPLGIYTQKRLGEELEKAKGLVEKNKARTAPATAERLKKSKARPHVTLANGHERNVERNEKRNDGVRARVPEPETETSPIGAVSGSPLPPPDDDASVARDLGIAPPASPPAAPSPLRNDWDQPPAPGPRGQTAFLKAFQEAGGDLTKLPGNHGAAARLRRERDDKALYERVNDKFKPQGPPPGTTNEDLDRRAAEEKARPHINTEDGT